MIDKRFHLVPQAGLLITIPNSHDRLVLRRLDLDEALNRAGRDYLVVASLRSVNASPGPEDRDDGGRQVEKGRHHLRLGPTDLKA